MKIPKVVKRLCRFCSKHTEHKVSQNKKRKASSLSRGSKYRIVKRGKSKGMGSRGKLSKPPINKWKSTGKKLSKKTDLRYECTECKKVTMQKKGIRAKRVEFV